LTALTIGCIIMLSFLLYSFNFFAALNSDCAIQVLMTYYFKLPHDLYYWGQDRWGSLIPLLSWFFLKVFPLRPITSVSFTYYFLLITGYIGYSKLFKTHFGKILFAIILFLPSFYFADVLWYAVGIQYSLLGISILLIRKINISENKKGSLKNHLLLASLVLLYILAVWVSDAALFSIAIIVVVNLIFHWKDIRIKSIILIYAVAGILIGTFFISYAKSTAGIVNENYFAFNNLNSILLSLNRILNSIADAMTFRNGEVPVSIYTVLVLIVVVTMVIMFLKNKIHLSSNTIKLMVIFILDALCVLVIALLSKWVFMNGTNRRYFLGCYISIGIAVAIASEHLIFSNKKQFAIKSFLLITVVTGALSTPWYYKFVFPKTLMPQLALYESFRGLGKIGIISEYWFSYVAACADPSLIVATPEEHDNVRNPWLAEQVFNQPSIYVIRNDWMKSFPDTLNQFGLTLIKSGNEFKINDCEMCKYERMY
jgi:hypothetical protein